MTTLWTTPHDWGTREPVSKEKLNAISDQLRYLYSPSIGIVTVRGTGSDASITGTTPSAVDDTLLGVTVETTGRLLKAKLHFVIANSTLGTFNNFDVLMDGTTYLSSLTGTQLTNGVWRQRQFVAAYQMTIDTEVLVAEGLISPGVHTFVPRAWVSANTMTVSLSAGYFAQFAVGEW